MSWLLFKKIISLFILWLKIAIWNKTEKTLEIKIGFGNCMHLGYGVRKNDHILINLCLFKIEHFTQTSVHFIDRYLQWRAKHEAKLR